MKSPWPPKLIWNLIAGQADTKVAQHQGNIQRINTFHNYLFFDKLLQKGKIIWFSVVFLASAWDSRSMGSHHDTYYEQLSSNLDLQKCSKTTSCHFSDLSVSWLSVSNKMERHQRANRFIMHRENMFLWNSDVNLSVDGVVLGGTGNSKISLNILRCRHKYKIYFPRRSPNRRWLEGSGSSGH